MAIGDVIRIGDTEFEIVFDGRQSLLGASPLRRGSSLSNELQQRAESEGSRERRKQQRAQEFFERLFR